MPAIAKLSDEDVKFLETVFPGALITKPEELNVYVSDASLQSGSHLCCVLPERVEQVQSLFAWADEKRIPVYVRGLKVFQNANAGQDNYVNGRYISNNGWVLTMQNGGTISPVDITKAKWQRIEGTPRFGYVVDGKVLDKYGVALVTFGDNYGAQREGSERGWWLNDKTLLPDNEQAADLGRVARHELAHALGITASRSAIRRNRANQKDEDGRPLYRFSSTETPDTVFYKHLIDERGNRARPGMEIITAEEFERRKAKILRWTRRISSSSAMCAAGI